MAIALRGGPVSWPMPFFRLVLRWIYLPLLLWIGGLLSMISLVEMPNGDTAFPRPGGDGSFGPAEWVSLFRLAIAAPGSAGFLASMAVLDLLKGAFAWTLPAARERLVTGQALLGAILAAPLALYVVGASGGATAIAVGTLGFVAFAIGGSLPRVSSVPAFALRLAVLIAAWKVAPTLAPLLMRQPFVLMAGSAIALVMTYRFGYGAGAARAHRDAWLWYGGQGASATGKPTRPQYTAWLKFEGRTWHRPLWRGTLIDWVRAGAYEVFGGARFGRFDMLFVSLVVFSLPFFMPISTPWVGAQMAVMMSTFMVVPVIQRGGPYPLSRRSRARAIYWSSAWALTVGAAAGFGWFFALAWLRLDAAQLEAVLTMEAGALALTSTALAPGFLWTAIRYEWLRSAQKGFTPILLVAMFGSMAFVIGGGELAATFIVDSGWFPSSLAKAAAIVGLALATQLAFWLLLQRHFLRGDLR